MRELKFRAWHKLDGWCGAFSMHQTGLVDYGSGWMTQEEANMVVTQYTGFKDKNGKEIYEGDIISIAHPRGVIFTGQVKCDNYTFYVPGFYFSHYDDPSDIFSEGTNFIEVIGNIYETQEKP